MPLSAEAFEGKIRELLDELWPSRSITRRRSLR